MANKLIVAPAPHVQTAQSTTRIMRDVVIALMPALVVSTVVFGLDVLRVTALSVVSCVVIEYLIQKFMVRGATTVGNWSAVVTGVLLAFNLPASIPWWIVVMGAFVAIAVAKMTFGGLGKNPFNPALVGRVFLLIAYPVQMTTWPLPVNGSFDVLSGATPLAAVKQGLAGPGAHRRAGDAAGQHPRFAGRGGRCGLAVRIRLPAVAARDHVAHSRDGARDDGCVRRGGCDVLRVVRRASAGCRRNLFGRL